MILFPSVDELLKRIDSRYSLVMLASKRAPLLDHYYSSKPVGKALEEIEADKVTIDPDHFEDLQD